MSTDEGIGNVQGFAINNEELLKIDERDHISDNVVVVATDTDKTICVDLRNLDKETRKWFRKAPRLADVAESYKMAQALVEAAEAIDVSGQEQETDGASSPDADPEPVPAKRAGKRSGAKKRVA